jgi:hypothetical protein
MTFAAGFLTAPPVQRAILHNAARPLNMVGADSSSLLDASAATTSLVYALASDIGASPKEFEPIMPDTGALIGIGAVIVFSAIATWVWANQVVPTSRTKLAISKRQGGVKEYLDELEQQGDDRPFEQWLFTDWLEGRNATAVAGRQKEPALPILKKAKWNSGDNPILAATALIMLGVTIASVTERVSLLLS